MKESKSRFRISWLPLAGLVLPPITLLTGDIQWTAASFVFTIVVEFAATAAGLAVPRSRPITLSAVVAVLVAGFLLPQATYPGSLYVLAALLSFSLGSILPRPGGRPAKIAVSPIPALAGVATAAVLAGLHLLAPFAAYLVLTGLVLCASAAQWRRRKGLPPWASSSIAGLVVASTVVCGAWAGATSPRASWFGALTWHGPRDIPAVAITFDDGPNGDFTLKVAAILEEHGVRGAFFEVGRAVALEPEVTQSLVARGHIVGDHSFSHSNYGFLRPGYPERKPTQRAIADAAGVCPAFYRPPHGTHSPLLSHYVANSGLHVITWDVSAHDWDRNDPAGLARDVLDRARPGSIILLHDGLDGHPGVDRSVVVEALPAILDGLQQRGLKVVGLDQLLRRDAYQPVERCGSTSSRS